MVSAEILGPDMLIIVAVIVLLFGSSQVPKLARSIGSAKREFEEALGAAAGEDLPEVKEPAARAPGDRPMTKDEVDAMLRNSPRGVGPRDRPGQ